jgi:hypothetical protein
MTQGSRAWPLALYNLLTAGEWPPGRGRPWLAYFLLPGLLGFGLFSGVVRASRGPPGAEGMWN